MSIRKLGMVVIAALVVVGVGNASAATPVGVDGAIGSEWAAVTPTFVDFTDGSAPGAHLVDFNVYVRADVDFLYVAVEALPVSGDQWDTAVGLGLGSSANIYLDTDVSGSSDLIIETLAGDYCDSSCSTVIPIGDPAAGPSVWSVGYPGLASTDPGGPVGGVREIAIPWTVLQTDPDGIGFPTATCSANVRTIQAFGYNFSGSQFLNRFGTVSQPGCGGVGPPTTKDQCKKDGWMTFNTPRTFKNQGDCIQFVNTGK